MAQIGAQILPIFQMAVQALAPVFATLTAELQSGDSYMGSLVRLLAIAGPLLIAVSHRGAGPVGGVVPRIIGSEKC